MATVKRELTAEDETERRGQAILVERQRTDDTDRDASQAARVLLASFSVLTFVAFGDLFVLALRTDSWFAWTIEPPLSAAFLGAGYGAGCVLSVLSLRSRSWASSQVAMITVWVFTVLTLLATLLHLDRFHFQAPNWSARGAAWLWLGVYLVVPVALGIVVITLHQRLGRSQVRPLPGWLAVPLALQGSLMLVVGAMLLLVPDQATGWWPWPLTPLTAQMVAAWLVAFGVAAGLSLVERDLHRLRIATIGYTVFGLLELAALVSYDEVVRWGSPAATVYLIGLVSVVATGTAGWLLVARPGIAAKRADTAADQKVRP